MSAANAAIVQQDLRARLDAACAEGIGPNLDRWLDFALVRSGDVIELAALDVPERRGYESTWTARVTGPGHAKTLLSRPPENAPGLYVLRNLPIPEIAALKGGANKWLKAGKGGRPADKHIAFCTSIYLDIDPVRPGTLPISATLEERAAAWARAHAVLETLLRVGVPRDAIGVGDSGNGTALYIALERLPETAELCAARESICASLHALHGDEHVKIDTTGASSARLHPAYGTAKRKGDNTPDRRHRPTGFIALGSPILRLGSLSDVQALAASLLALVPTEPREELAAPKPARGAAKPPTKARPGRAGRYDRAKASCTMDEIVAHLGAPREGDRIHCTGCGRVTAEIFVPASGEEGAKCHHDTCGALFAGKVDYWAGYRRIKPAEALEEIEAWKGIDPPVRRERRPVAEQARLAPERATALLSRGEAPPPVLGGPLSLEIDVARYLVHKHQADIRYADGVGWVVWKDTHWKRDTAEEVREFAKGCVNDLRLKAAETNDDALWKLTQSVGRARALGALLDAARSDPAIRISADQLDAKPHLLACLNGTVDLRTGELRPHDRADLLTRVAPTVYDPKARSDNFDRLLEHLIPNPEARAYLQRLVGYSLYGHTTEDVVILLVGPPRCGKGTFLGSMRASLGPHYAEPDAASFCAPLRPLDPDKPRSDLVSLVGRRVAAVPEGVVGRRIDAGLIKRLAGGDKLTVRELHGKTFTVDVTFAIWMVANDDELPALEANDAALWERIRRIPVGATVPEGERDTKFREALGTPESRAAFLAWGVRGSVLWHNEGLGPVPASVRQASEALRSEMDPLRAFLDTMVTFERFAVTPKATIKEALEAWCEGEGTKPPGAKRIAAALHAAGESARIAVEATTARVSGKVIRAWRGLRLATDDERREREEQADQERVCRRVDATGGQLCINPPPRAREANNTQRASTSVYTSTSPDGEPGDAWEPGAEELPSDALDFDPAALDGGGRAERF